MPYHDSFVLFMELFNATCATHSTLPQLVHDKIKAMVGADTCDNCEEEIDFEDDGHYICDQCQENQCDTCRCDMICNQCGETICYQECNLGFTGDMAYGYLCKDCCILTCSRCEENYTASWEECEDILEDDLPDKTFCKSCRDNYTCKECDEVCDEVESICDNCKTKLCEDCTENLQRCNTCGDRICTNNCNLGFCDGFVCVSCRADARNREKEIEQQSKRRK